jgi:tetratricopeptide (TPR) repeat protein
MKTIFTFLLTLSTLTIFGNINYIQFEKIPRSDKYIDKYDFIKNNERYYNHWQPDWTYDISKKSLVKGLKESYDLFSKLDNENIEINLLLGDISHYLNNLDEDKYYELAVNHYRKAIDLAPNDYRPLWFIANHYAQSNVQDKSIEYFLKSQKLLPSDEPAAFWEEYTFATAVANMPSHCIYAMDKAKSILGEPSYFEQKVGQTIYNRIIPVKMDSTYGYTDIWTAYKGDLISFVCRPFGLKLLIDSTWQINFYNYKNYQTAVTIIPPAIPNKNGREIKYTIALMMRVAQPGETLENFIDNFVSRYPDKENFEFSYKYPDLISYELKDENMYQDIGGAHIHMIGIKRERPKYAGLLLEQPITIPQGETNKIISNEIIFYKAGESKDRFDGQIYYAVTLDVCEDIYDEAYSLFKETFEKRIIIE